MLARKHTHITTAATHTHTHARTRAPPPPPSPPPPPFLFAGLAAQGWDKIKEFLEGRREHAKKDEQRVYEKSVLMWEADHYNVFEQIESLRVHPEPWARVPAAVYNIR